MALKYQLVDFYSQTGIFQAGGNYRSCKWSGILNAKKWELQMICGCIRMQAAWQLATERREFDRVGRSDVIDSIQWQNIPVWFCFTGGQLLILRFECSLPWLRKQKYVCWWFSSAIVVVVFVIVDVLVVVIVVVILEALAFSTVLRVRIIVRQLLIPWLSCSYNGCIPVAFQSLPIIVTLKMMQLFGRSMLLFPMRHSVSKHLQNHRCKVDKIA